MGGAPGRWKNRAMASPGSPTAELLSIMVASISSAADPGRFGDTATVERFVRIGRQLSKVRGGEKTPTNPVGACRWGGAGGAGQRLQAADTTKRRVYLAARVRLGRAWEGRRVCKSTLLPRVGSNADPQEPFHRSPQTSSIAGGSTLAIGKCNATITPTSAVPLARGRIHRRGAARTRTGEVRPGAPRTRGVPPCPLPFWGEQAKERGRRKGSAVPGRLSDSRLHR